MAITKAKAEKKSDERATPWNPFDLLNREFRFSLDPCATVGSAKCERFYMAEEDGLSRPWAGERVWLNPPYGKGLSDWIGKAVSGVRQSCPLVVALFPPRTDARWFLELASQADEVRLLQGRVHFINPNNPADRPADGSCVAVFRRANPGDPRPQPDFRLWNWKTNTF